MTTDHKVCEFRPFVYSVGCLDEANYIFCKQYASELSSWGYKEGRDFLFRIKKGGHKLDLSSFLDDLAFLLSAAKLRS